MTTFTLLISTTKESPLLMSKIQNNQPTKLTFSKKYAFGSVDRIETVLPQFSERLDKKWVLFGEDNLYPSFLIQLYNTSAINRTCIVSKADGVIGQGLEFENEADNYLIKVVNPLESWNDVYEKVSLDYVLFSGFALNIIWDNIGEKIAEIYHLDFSNVRSGPINPKADAVDTYFYCSDWANYRRLKPQEYHAFDPSKAKEFPSQILYYFDYSPGTMYYPTASYSGALNDIQTDVEVSRFHINNLANGLAPGLVISLRNGIPEDPEAREEVFAEINQAYAGSENAGKFMLLFSEDADHSPEITPIESANSDYYITLETRITSRILSAHKISSPLLIGLNIEGQGFNSNADEIQTAYQHFLSTVVKPMQKSLLKVFNRLLYYKGFADKELIVKPNRLIDSVTTSEAIE